jgi:septum formation protein
MPADFVFLASASPRRRELLRQIGVACRVLKVSVDESVHRLEAPADYVARLAVLKAEAGWNVQASRDAAVLAADTSVVFRGEIFGKPQSASDGEAMLLKLSGQTHEVLTAVALRTAAGTECRVSRSEVTFRPIERAEARTYWDSGEPQDKAGGYAVQGMGAIFVAHLNGSFSGVMGLPLFETAALLEGARVPRWRPLENEA